MSQHDLTALALAIIIRSVWSLGSPAAAPLHGRWIQLAILSACASHRRRA